MARLRQKPAFLHVAFGGNHQPPAKAPSCPHPPAVCLKCLCGVLDTDDSRTDHRFAIHRSVELNCEITVLAVLREVWALRSGDGVSHEDLLIVLHNVVLGVVRVHRTHRRERHRPVRVDDKARLKVVSFVEYGCVVACGPQIPSGAC